MSTLRGVVSVILDDNELDWGGPGSEDKSTDMTVVVVRRKGLGIYRLGTRLTAIKVHLLNSCLSFADSTTGYTTSIPTHTPRRIFHLPVCWHTFDHDLQHHRLV